ncbi:DNA-binding transcriptional regulator YciT [Pantoea stewartii]|uniref:DeoR faimly transcriptional regulator n=1 Tax=Pantoea stewartii TaxID=66269 RepID=A0AB34VDX4_9GAMM|nr:DNA-binding transcriptional regulator YciT [Pantoea stewartii]KHE01190.1 DeoR faimly transcriptional regulator [Pantoea stewartii]KHN63485.1 DeoR faimly transcriptional regulator [Pantoea stewartii]KTS73636.1 DeoR faimly transcriptional regulator [Pantoea stewartii]KTS96564.1 DeoR faimly transcriptional regulator [Pantoea stewartii]KTT06298.1 DeoR faimly transcriptional regulator [Pantoea stewartii]
MNTRQEKIIELVNARGSITVSELARVVSVSEVTIRQDLTQLEQQRVLRRVHGAAIALDSDNVSTRMNTRFSIKQALARYAAGRVNEGESVFIEGGSTNALLALALASRKNLTLITVSHYIAHLLKEADCEVIVLGGRLQKSSESMTGPLTRYCIQQIHFHKAFIGADGWHPETGFTGRDMLRCDVVDAVLAKNAESYILTDSSKFGQLYPYPLSPGYAPRHVITEHGLPADTVNRLTEQGTEVIPVTIA